MKYLNTIFTITLFLLLSVLSSCEKEAVNEVVSTNPIDVNDPCEDQEVAFLEPFPEAKVVCGEDDLMFYVNESGKDQTVTVKGTDNCENSDSYIELKREEQNADGNYVKVKIKEMDIPDGTSRVKTWVIKDGQFLSFYCWGESPDGSCKWSISVK